jgi:hypothetical protein
MTGISLPTEHRDHSPFTGWTRDHWEYLADALLEGVRRYATPGHALIQPPGGRSSSSGSRSDGLEGFARSFLLAAFRLAGASGSAPGDLQDWYARGVATGSDPKSREAWPRASETRQAVVEAAFIALALAETRPWIWDRLDGRVRSNVLAWLSSIDEPPIPNNNWALFPVVVNTFLKSVGADYRQGIVDRGLDVVDTWYRRDGWYTDGPGRNYDYYIGWALHFWTLMWCRLDGARSDPDRVATYRDRVRRYLEQYHYLFGANGAPLYHGRSLTYRFATVAPLWAAALLDASPLPPGETRRIASGALRYFIEHGAVRGDGVLTLGWHGEFLPMLQPYSGPGSPYWAAKAFLGLLLPVDHPTWTDREEPAPIDRGDFCVAMPEPGFVARGTAADGVVRVSNHRSDHFGVPSRPPLSRRRRFRAAAAVLRTGRLGTPLQAHYDAHYCKLSYSTHAAPDLGERADIDSQVVLLDEHAKPSRRTRFFPVAVADRFAASVVLPNEPRPSPRLETVAISRGAAEIRIHHVMTSEPRAVRDGGFSLADDEPPEVATGESWCMVSRPDGLTSFIGALHAPTEPRVQRMVGANPFGRHSAAPYLLGRRPVMVEGVFASLVVLTSEAFDPDAALDEIELAVAGRTVRVSCADGEQFLVQLVAPEPLDTKLGHERLEGPIRYARVSPDGSRFLLPG